MTKEIREGEVVEIIFRKWARHHKTGKPIRPKNGARALMIRLKKPAPKKLSISAAS